MGSGGSKSNHTSEELIQSGSGRQSGSPEAESGVIATVDAMVPIGRGQRELAANEKNTKHIHHTVTQALHYLDKTNKLKDERDLERLSSEPRLRLESRHK